MNQPRVWELTDPADAWEPNVLGPEVGVNERVKVIEAEPVADLLEQLIDAARYAPEYFIEKWGIDKTVEQAADLLKALGRLDGEAGRCNSTWPTAEGLIRCALPVGHDPPHASSPGGEAGDE